MGKKKRGSRRNLGFAKQTTEKDGGCLLSGKIVGDTHGKDGDASTSFVAASISGSPVCGDLAVQQPPKSPSLSRTLGECDKATTGLDKTEESGTKGCVTYTPPLDSNVNSNEKPSGDNSLGVPSPELSLQCNTADVPSSNVVCPPVPVHSCSGLNALGGSVPDQRILDSGGSQHLHQEDMSEEPLKMGNRKKNNLKSQDVVPVPSSSKVVDKGTSFSIQEAVKSPSMHESILSGLEFD
ncbi:Uncharacterized protein Fot_29164 [Forsythia ovata]|uniref:Uncharacterized protein n=1 Tax=Forsythia ovata TaxID=205694 RepID=A0ABD1TRK8_9LAMI